MSAATSYTPFSEERGHLSAALEGLAVELSKMLDRRLNCFLPGFAKAEAVKAMIPARRLIFDAQQCAYMLRQNYSVISCREADGFAVFADEESQLLRQIMDDMEAAYLSGKKLTAALQVWMTGDA